MKFNKEAKNNIEVVFSPNFIDITITFNLDISYLLSNLLTADIILIDIAGG
jgi:rRNA-processing protein FCF1